MVNRACPGGCDCFGFCSSCCCGVVVIFEVVKIEVNVVVGGCSGCGLLCLLWLCRWL